MRSCGKKLKATETYSTPFCFDRNSGSRIVLLSASNGLGLLLLCTRVSHQRVSLLALPLIRRRRRKLSTHPQGWSSSGWLTNNQNQFLYYAEPPGIAVFSLSQKLLPACNCWLSMIWSISSFVDGWTVPHTIQFGLFPSTHIF
jgi:hypothetical protein